MTLPDDDFSVSDVKLLVGSRRTVDVMDCKTQQAMEMSMRDFEKYFMNKGNRKQILNVISLEFSGSPLDPYVQRPRVVNSMDWIDLAWPPHLKQTQKDQTNNMGEMKYPKVQKYCLMSVAGCYTDFHIDFGGTSVWYHIIKGGKIFWLIPPSDKNIKLYEKWILSGNQGDVFLGDMVTECQRVELKAGDSLMIPSGWIHSVYTPFDSLVFGGNFLNSFNIGMQIKVAEVESRIKVPNRFRFPFYHEMSWYVLERYVFSLMGRSFLSKEYKLLNKVDNEKPQNGQQQHHHGFQNGHGDKLCDENKKHFTKTEYLGFVKLVEKLDSLPLHSRFVPDGIADPEGLLQAAKAMLHEHSADDPELAITGCALAYWPDLKQPREVSRGRKLPSVGGGGVHKVKIPKTITPLPTIKKASSRIRRVRCKQCDSCKRDDCRTCIYCKDMKKYDGPGTMKQTCLMRRCLKPILPNRKREELAAEELLLHQQAADHMSHHDEESEMEISLEIKTEENSSPTIPSTDSLSPVQTGDDEPPIKSQKMYSSELVEFNSMEASSSDDEWARQRVPRILVKRIPLEETVQYPVPPIPTSTSKSYSFLPKEMIGELFPCRVWETILKHVSQDDLRSFASVSKAFLVLTSDKKLWRECNLDNQTLSTEMLNFIIRKAPETLSISTTNISYKELLWVIQRMPNLRSLNLSNNSWSSVVALSDDSCPPLTRLDISFLSRFDDDNLRTLLSIPAESRPGRNVPQGRLSFCRDLNLAASSISDVSMKLIATKLMHLEKINISFTDITDKGVSTLFREGSGKLKAIIAQSCNRLTDATVETLQKVKRLLEADFSRCMKISVCKLLWLCKLNSLRADLDPKRLVSVKSSK